MAFVTDKEWQGAGQFGCWFAKSMLGGVPGVFIWFELSHD